MTYIRSRDLGFDREQILVIPLNGEVRRNYEGFRSELLKNPGVENAATSAFVPTGGSAHSPMNFEGGTTGNDPGHLFSRQGVRRDLRDQARGRADGRAAGREGRDLGNC